MSQSYIDAQAEKFAQAGDPLADVKAREREWARRAHPSAELHNIPVRCFLCETELDEIDLTPHMLVENVRGGLFPMETAKTINTVKTSLQINSWQRIIDLELATGSRSCDKKYLESVKKAQPNQSWFPWGAWVGFMEQGILLGGDEWTVNACDKQWVRFINCDIIYIYIYI